MKTVQIFNGIVYHIYPQYASASEAKQYFAPNIQFEDAPNDTFEGWLFDSTKTGDERFSRPAIPEGYAWDESGDVPIVYDPAQRAKDERTRLHGETTNDTLQALRKIREGDTSYDWQGWLDKLDAYNVAIEKTKDQKDYPLKVVYPEYPTR